MFGLKEGFGNEKLPSVVKNPFSKKKVTRIYVFYSLQWDETWEAVGHVEFKNGDTKGEQKFKGKTFDEVVLKIKALLDEL